MWFEISLFKNSKAFNTNTASGFMQDGRACYDGPQKDFYFLHYVFEFINALRGASKLQFNKAQTITNF